MKERKESIRLNDFREDSFASSSHSLYLPFSHHLSIVFSVLLTRCPIDDEIMGPFEYSHNKTRGTVAFQAHKFPYTSSVYYQCNVRLCLKESGGCEDVVSISYIYLVNSFSLLHGLSQTGN